MERQGHHSKLANPLEAKRRMGLTNKTDKLDAEGLTILLRNGTLPEVWIPPAELRDQRELLRLRIFRGPYRPPQSERVMLPMTVLRRFDCVLASTKAKVLAEHASCTHHPAAALAGPLRLPHRRWMR